MKQTMEERLAARRMELAEAWRTVLARAATRRRMVLDARAREARLDRLAAVAGGGCACRDALHRV